jgi:hypothetical protein
VSLDEGYEYLKAAHDYLVQQGQRTIAQSAAVAGVDGWGSQVKRIRVMLSDGSKPAAIPVTVTDHNLVEVINQCATMERLLDTLRWLQLAESGLSHCQIRACHPTTSSNQGAEHYNQDLVLIGPDHSLAKFEVSDVANAQDGNRKEEKDLTSLGVLFKGSGATKFQIKWPVDRLFLVVSEIFATRLRQKTRSWLKQGHCHYVEVKASGPTRIFEVKLGPN